METSNYNLSKLNRQMKMERKEHKGHKEFEEELAKRREKVYSFLVSSRYASQFRLTHIRDSVYSYMKHGGKSLRPAVLLFSCGAVGGDEDVALPAAAAVEVFHTWTLVHDDIIDRDKRRRGGLTVHEEFKKRAIDEFDYDGQSARHYGLSVAMLAGDMQHGWAVSILAEMANHSGVKPEVALHLISDSEMRVLRTLIDGEMLDIQYSKIAMNKLNEELIIDMLWKKTGVLYEFAGKAGAMLGLNSEDLNHKYVKAISAFCGKCGLAFQLQDDILGAVGDERILGKPVGSDMREGKRTVIAYYAFKNATEPQRAKLLQILGNHRAKKDQVKSAIKMMRDLGAIEYTEKLARSYIEEAIPYLKKIPDSKYKSFLTAWADYMIERKF